MANALGSVALVALGSALGGVARYLGSLLAARAFGESFPWGTLLVNVTGSAVIGFLAAVVVPEGRWWLAPPAQQFLFVGVLGGFTTFSSFSLQTLELARLGHGWLAAGYVASSVVLSLAAVWAGHAAGQLLAR